MILFAKHFPKPEHSCINQPDEAADAEKPAV